MKKHEKLFELAQNLAKKTYGFLDTKGPGIGNHATNQFISQLRQFPKKNSEMITANRIYVVTIHYL